MTVEAMTRTAGRLLEAARRSAPPRSPVLDRLREGPASVMALAGMTADPWQQRLLSSTSPRTLLLACRQAGKSTTTGALALLTALIQAPALVLLLSPSLRQSGELFRKVMDFYTALGRPVEAAMESALRLELANGSRIISLPGTEGTIRGYSGVTLLIVDEAARVPDPLYYSVRPMLAVSQGRLIALSTPYGKRGWFFDEWEGPGPWTRLKITADQCPRIPPEFLEEERRALGPRWFSQEYLCSFEETIDAVFRTEDIEAAVRAAVQPLTLEA